MNDSISAKSDIPEALPLIYHCGLIWCSLEGIKVVEPFDFKLITTVQ